MIEPLVDVIVPVHTDSRPVARAVGSVLEGTQNAVRVNVVCHNIDESSIASALGNWANDSRVRLLRYNDGFGSPAGPINFGLDAATGAFTALLDSDDSYEPGAVDAWLGVQARDRADVVIPMFKYADGSSTRTPPTRPLRTRRLEGSRDRLAYRTRQHGLVSRERFPALRMTPGLRSGEDVIQGATIWYSDARISFARNTPAYRIHEDAGERASTTPKPAVESLAFLDAVLDPTFIEALTGAERESFAVKLLKTHIMDILNVALAAGEQSELNAVARAVHRIEAIAPRVHEILSHRDARILRNLTNGSANRELLIADLAVRTDYRRPLNVLSAVGLRNFHSQAPLRFLVATLLTR